MQPGGILVEKEELSGGVLETPVGEIEWSDGLLENQVELSHSIPKTPKVCHCKSKISSLVRMRTVSFICFGFRLSF